ncbi:restriction endonuclease subunit S [Helicobacter pylori]|uniref:restriction endonuclease subunit S n=1 Tax=Helicobacter pylori TaxID=210 RepID=UPI0009A44C76|nr:restriction endonuclease subunit S [Helicobacter pylori]NHA19194.1 restriction endonuclease subunit S [Helicobacter pylori]OPG23455.1 restriction endonuclease subunit S [Helicobacter pylori]QEF26607.1 restriction endonuclease subunit S [Helicobacter pylori]
MDALMLPSNWQRVRLGDIAEIKRGVRITKNELDVFGKYPVVSGGVGFLGYTNNFNRYENTITIAQYGTAGYINFQKNKFWANDVCFCIYPNKDIIKNIFLYYFLKVNQNYLYEISNRNATPYSISKDKILDFEIPLPPLNEQIAIANVLSGLDRYLYSLDALILKKEGVKKALSFELLSQRKRLKGFNQAWQRVRLGDIGKPCMCKRVMKHQTTRYGEIPFYKIGTFGNTADAFISKKLFLEYKTKYSFPKKGDILISASGTIGRAVIYDGKPAYFQDSNIVWIDNDETLVKNDFLFYAYSNIKWNTEHTTILRLYNDNFRNTLIPLPPLNEQIAIANVLSALDSEIISLKNKKRQFENIKKALNHDLMSAKIRVLNK